VQLQDEVLYIGHDLLHQLVELLVDAHHPARHYLSRLAHDLPRCLLTVHHHRVVEVVLQDLYHFLDLIVHEGEGD
jgi:hypothetical protein